MTDAPAVSSCHWMYSACEKHEARLLGKWVGVGQHRRAGEEAEGGAHRGGPLGGGGGGAAETPPLPKSTPGGSAQTLKGGESGGATPPTAASASDGGRGGSGGRGEPPPAAAGDSSPAPATVHAVDATPTWAAAAPLGSRRLRERPTGTCRFRGRPSPRRPSPTRRGGGCTTPRHHRTLLPRQI